MSKKKLKLGFYWAASCGGCEIAVLEIAEKILDVIQIADIVFWPCVTDFKYKDVENYEDGHIDVCFFNGAIRNTENAELARLLRKKSKVLVAYGACATDGGIPALGNLYSCSDMFDRIYKESPSTDNPEGVTPQLRFKVPEGEIELPEILGTCLKLNAVVDVDYYVPGCPPTEKQTWACIEAIAAGKLPPKGSVIGAGDKSVCDECPRERKSTRISAFHRPHTFEPDPDQCLLEQGILCMGSATRSGCEARCLDANLPCRGCYGPPGNTLDQGAAVLSAVGSMIEADNVEDAQRIIADMADPAGNAYRFGMASSLLLRNLPDNK